MREIRISINTLKSISLCGQCTTGANKTGGCAECERKVTKDLAIKSLEKQIPKKPILNDDEDHVCPECHGGFIYPNYVTEDKHQHCNYCNECGQRLDWDNNPEMLKESD